MRDYKRVKNGRWINKHTGYFVDKKMCKKLDRESTKSNKSDCSKHATQKLVIRKYEDGSFTVDTHMCDADILYFGEMLKQSVIHFIKKDLRDHKEY